MATAQKKAFQSIRIRGARQNNLKSVNLDIPLGKLVVVTGLSGTGKSSLVFETLHAEGNRRYVETFSPYTRQFMERMDRPKVDSIENIHPSIAIEQGNTVKTSRSTVGTMTELCDFFKVWFSSHAKLFDPDTGEEITQDSPDTIYKKLLQRFPGELVSIAFAIHKPRNLEWKEIIHSISGQGYSRICVANTFFRIDDLDLSFLADFDECIVVQDRIKVENKGRARVIESLKTALRFGEGQISILNENAEAVARFSEGLHRPGSNQRFRPPSPNLFSFNSPVGACPTCRGFGRIIELDDRLVIPDQSLSLSDGAIKAFSGAVYSESQRDLLEACRRLQIPTTRPWKDLSDQEKAFVMEGEPDYEARKASGSRSWYGVYRFFKWLEENTYKMHVRVFLSRYRAYVTCPTCNGKRLQPEALCWKWEGFSLPDLYDLPVGELYQIFQDKAKPTGDRQVDSAYDGIVHRLGYLNAVGLGYLTLNRSSRSLSGGETQRVNLTSCLGTSLVETLFILDEPSIGLHCRDIDRLVKTLRDLTRQGNTVVVVEHDEAVMNAADVIVEMGPTPGSGGGNVTFAGTLAGIKRKASSPTGQFLSGKATIPPPEFTRPVDKKTDFLRLEGITKNNLDNVSVKIPLNRFVALSGVSGSGKSTLLYNGIYQGLLARSGKSVTDPAAIADISLSVGFSEILLVDQSSVSKTPRSNPALFVSAWDHVRQLFAQTDAAMQGALTASAFSFNSSVGRCPNCEGLGYERIEMQFMADLFVPCPVCEGKRFMQEILEVKWRGRSISDVLELTVSEAIEVFKDHPRIIHLLKPLVDVGLAYLPLGQPLNTLSGGESQRLKLVRFLGRIGKDNEHALLLLDEPTTGLHRQDIRQLIAVMQQLVERGHSVIVIEHQPDVLRSADWLIEMGPEAGKEGGRIIFEGTPVELTKAGTATSDFVSDNFQQAYVVPAKAKKSKKASAGLTVSGAREHNLKNISLTIPHNAITVVTGVSGSGKSTLAFDIVFAEGQRRFMESMSAWARQYVEQLPKPDIDNLSGIAPTIAIEQRVTRGSRKSTVATITEVAQYLRLLCARLGHQHSPTTGERLVSMDPDAMTALLQKRLKEIFAKSSQGQGKKKSGPATILLLAPLIKGRKGHHEPIANWARDHGYNTIRTDGFWTPIDRFKRLDRYKEHDIELVVCSITASTKGKPDFFLKETDRVACREAVDTALKIGKGTFFISSIDKAIEPEWFSTRRSDPVTGEAFPELDPKHFSWNASKGWCPTCRGHGMLYSWMEADERFEEVEDVTEDAVVCPDCQGDRLNHISRSVFLYDQKKQKWNLPSLLRLNPFELIESLQNLDLDSRDQSVFDELFPEIRERLRFMDEVGLGYLTMDRSTITLSGGEAQRIRLAAQLGSNLSGVLYVLDEPSIGLHARDGQRLLNSMQRLKKNGNTLLVVEHDPETMQQADMIIDLGPEAGIHGGEILAMGSLKEILRNPKSLTGKFLKDGIPHPLMGSKRPLPKDFNPRSKSAADEWFVLKKPTLRNLKGDDVFFPKGRLIGVCGISGTGKSTLIRDLLKPLIEEAIQSKEPRLKGSPARGFAQLLFANDFRQIIEVDQSPIGKTPRSTPATYNGAFDRIRTLFANTPEARMHGLNPGTFSFNTKGGRCETCKGAGRIKLEMNFMPDTYVPCDDCQGSRFSPDLQDIHWNGKSIADVLQMSFEEAAAFFSFDSQLSSLLELMCQTGLGYLTLGQSSPSLSGGEAQRLKLVSELVKGLPSLKDKRFHRSFSNVYILEEPTIGLHLSDVQRLLHLLHQMVDQGHTVIVIEHHLDVLADVDYLIEIGPEGGDKGGSLLFQGPPQDLANVENSPTSPFLSPLLSPSNK